MLLKFETSLLLFVFLLWFGGVDRKSILSVFTKYSNEICDGQTGQGLTMKCDFETFQVAMAVSQFLQGERWILATEVPFSSGIWVHDLWWC